MCDLRIATETHRVLKCSWTPADRVMLPPQLRKAPMLVLSRRKDEGVTIGPEAWSCWASRGVS
jgi:hypothetical protein